VTVLRLNKDLYGSNHARLGHLNPGRVVRCGPAGAIWRVGGIIQEFDDHWDVDLQPMDPHDVPLDYAVVELPMPGHDPHDPKNYQLESWSSDFKERRRPEPVEVVERGKVRVIE
jgi:hypothetical protein